ncbi:MAG TPA: glycosyltransferase [Treponemataceae bacterium]|nr:glycosyltransferase [Treponemataceae bacterium]
MNKKYLINASNLHVGGGVQVAISFLYECSLLSKDFSNYTIVVSSEVASGLKRIGANTSIFRSYQVIDTYGLKALTSPLNKLAKVHDVCFTVFGPNYLLKQSKVEIVGFAQPWMLYFDNPTLENLTPLQKLKLKVKFALQWAFFKRANMFVVELEHVQERLLQLKNIPQKRISVVYNTISSIYLNSSLWRSLPFFRKKEKISLGLVSRDYAHKNINTFPLVADILKTKYALDVHFYVTLTDEEMASKSSLFNQYVTSVGLLSPEECPSFYEQLDAVVFPSFLECFSASPLEAMVMSKPLFASDRNFVRDVCSEHAIYFDPTNPEDIAAKIADYFSSNNPDETLNLNAARCRVPDDQMSFRSYPLLVARELIQKVFREHTHEHQAT